MIYTRVTAAPAAVKGSPCETEDCHGIAVFSVEDYSARRFRPGVYQFLCGRCLEILIEAETILACAIARTVRLVIEQRHAIGGEAGSLIGENYLETLQIVRELTRDEEAYERVVDQIHSWCRDAINLADEQAEVRPMDPRAERETAEAAGYAAAWQCTALDVRHC